MNNYFDVKKDVIARVKEKYGRTPSMCIVVGQRGVGKTHSALKECLIHAIKDGLYFVYVRRKTTEIHVAEMNSVFTDVIKDRDVQKVLRECGFDDERYIIVARAGVFWLCRVNQSDALDWLLRVGVYTCIAHAEQFKGGTYSDFDRIIFDEFITEMGYTRGDREPELFQKIVNTVGRKPNDERRSKEIIVYLCGNPDYSIEACPYLYSLHLDYANMQPNLPYYYERRNGEITTFTKVSRNTGETYIDPSVTNLFDTAEEIMSLTGEVKENEYIRLTSEILADFEPHYTLIVETPIITKIAYHKVIYANYGYLKHQNSFTEPALLVTAHDDFKKVPHLYCRYDKEFYKPRRYPQTFRVNIPNDPVFADLRRLMDHVDKTQLIFTSANKLATLYDTMREIS